jgi:hypothetical protein
MPISQEMPNLGFLQVICICGCGAWIGWEAGFFVEIDAVLRVITGRVDAMGLEELQPHSTVAVSGFVDEVFAIDTMPRQTNAWHSAKQKSVSDLAACRQAGD